MGDAAAHTVKNVFAARDNKPVAVIVEKLARYLFIPAFLCVRGTLDKWFPDEDIQGMKAADRGMVLVIFQNLFSKFQRYIVKSA